MDRLKLQQLVEMFGYSQSSFKSNFKRTIAAIKKKYGVSIVKCEDIDGVYYQIFESNENRAKTIYDEDSIQNLLITQDSLKFETYQFFTFLTLSAFPYGAYRGTRKNFLEYMGIKVNKKNLQILDQVLESLVQKKYIAFHEDQDYIIIYLRTELEKQYMIDIQLLKKCREIADENKKNINKLGQLIKVAIAIMICEKNQPYTYKDLSELTGLSYKQIRSVKKLLKQNDIFISKRAGNYLYCLGEYAELNGFYF